MIQLRDGHMVTFVQGIFVDFQGLDMIYVPLNLVLQVPDVSGHLLMHVLLVSGHLLMHVLLVTFQVAVVLIGLVKLVTFVL